MVPKTVDGERPQINDGEWYEGDIVSSKDAKSSLKSGIIQRNSIFWNDAKDVSDFYVEDTTKKKPPWQNPFGNPMPCCFNIKNIDTTKQANKVDEVNDILLDFLGQNPSKFFLAKKIKMEKYELLATKIDNNIKKLDNEILVSSIKEIISDIKKIQSFKEIKKAIKKYNDILKKNNKLIDEINEIDQTNDNKKLIKDIIKDIKILNKYIENENNRLKQGENEINLYDKFTSEESTKFIPKREPGIISGFYKVRLENNSIMDCFLRISKYMQNKDDIKDELELLDIDELIKEAEKYDISEDIKNIEDTEEKRIKIIDILVDQIGETEPVETVKSKTRGDITNIQNLNSLYDSEIVYDDVELEEEENKISEYYELNKNLLVNLKDKPQIDFNNIINRKKDEGLLPNLKSLDKNKKDIKSELDKYFLEQILTNYFESKKIDKDDFNSDLVIFQSLIGIPKIWDQEALEKYVKDQKSYKNSQQYKNIIYLLEKYSEKKFSDKFEFKNPNDLFNELFNQNRIINRKISTLIDSYIYKKYMNGYKKYLIKNIRENPLDFLRASDGNILSSFYSSDNSKGDTLYDKIDNAISEYSKYINNESKHNDLFIIPVIKSILPEFVDTNIVVFDRLDSMGEQIKIPFDYFNDVDKNKKFVFIVKNGNIYEPLFYTYIEDNTNNNLKNKTLTDNAVIKNSTIVKRKAILNMDTRNKFLKSSLEKINDELIDIYKMNNSIPDNILKYEDLIEILEKRNITVDKYFINIDNKVSHIITTDKIVIPIYPCGLMKKNPDGEIIGKDNIIYNYNKLPSPEISDYKKILSFYDNLNKKTDNKFNYKSKQLNPIMQWIRSRIKEAKSKSRSPEPTKAGTPSEKKSGGTERTIRN